MKTQGIPRRESELYWWSEHLKRCLCIQGARYGVDASLAEEYRRVHDAFDKAYCISPAERTAAAVAAKNEARSELVALAQQIVRMIQHRPETTDTHRAELGLRIPKEKVTPIAPPREAPELDVGSAVDDKVHIRLLRNLHQCAKPADAKGALVFVHHGEAPPQSLHEWTLAGNFTKARMEVDVPAARIGVPIWLCAVWYNRRGDIGPVSEVVYTMMSYSQEHLAAGTVAVAS